MPTINEVWEQAQQINANLVTIHGDVDSLETRANQTIAALAALYQLTSEGLASLSAGMAAAHARQDTTNLLLASLVEHQQAVVCLLEQIARSSCGTWNEAAVQTRLERGTLEAARALEHMYASTNPAGALAWTRHEEDRARVRACCPEREPSPACDPGPCPRPKGPTVPDAPDYPVFRPEPPRRGDQVLTHVPG